MTTSFILPRVRGAALLVRAASLESVLQLPPHMDWVKKAEETSSLKKNHLDISYHQKNVDESKEHEGKVPGKNPFSDEWLRTSRNS